MSNDLNIVCFLWNGDRWSVEEHKGYLYVNTLYQAVQKHLSLPHRFICMTNLSKSRFTKGIELLHLDAPLWKGCLPKIAMFNPKLDLKGQVLSLDIDIIITGSLDEMASCRQPFIVRSSFRNPKELDGDIVGFNTDKFDIERIWKPLVTDRKKVLHLTGGRERFWYRHVLGKGMDTWQDLYPGQLLSYKNHLRGGKPLPENTRIVSCHGRPRPHELKERWAIENWRNL